MIELNWIRQAMGKILIVLINIIHITFENVMRNESFIDSAPTLTLLAFNTSDYLGEIEKTMF
jgi:hypothetical protein